MDENVTLTMNRLDPIVRVCISYIQCIDDVGFVDEYLQQQAASVALRILRIALNFG